MHPSIFYSWQSDLPAEITRHFVRRAAERAVEALSTVGLKVALGEGIDGTTGALSISQAVLRKIDQAEIMLADVTPVGRAQKSKKLLPNPNVMMEVGYGLARLGPERVFLVLNEAFVSDLTDMPFDVRDRRVLSFRLTKRAKPRQIETESQRLAEGLAEGIRAVLTGQSTWLQHHQENAVRDFYGTLSRAIEGTCDWNEVVETMTTGFRERIQKGVPKLEGEEEGAWLQRLYETTRPMKVAFLEPTHSPGEEVQFDVIVSYEDANPENTVGRSLQDQSTVSIPCFYEAFPCADDLFSAVQRDVAAAYELDEGARRGLAEILREIPFGRVRQPNLVRELGERLKLPKRPLEGLGARVNRLRHVHILQMGRVTVRREHGAWRVEKIALRWHTYRDVNSVD